jgi:hypothetical protein
MTGVYISEVCLIGLFAINTAPGPIVLMVIFLVFTAIYHAAMRHALLPLTRYLPSSLDGDAQLALFSHADIHAYNATTAAGVPPSEWTPTPSKKLSTTKTTLLTRIFSPQNFVSHQSVRSLVPPYTPPTYTDPEILQAYYNPAITTERPKIWIVRDELGISRQECVDSGKVVDASDEWAGFDGKGKVRWDMLRDGDREGTGVALKRVPVWEKRVDY